MPAARPAGRFAAGVRHGVVGLIAISAALVLLPLGSATAVQAQRVPACSAGLLFAAAVAKEHFDPHDPSYADLPATDSPTAHAASCFGRWAFAMVSRPNVGTTDGGTIFRARHGRWVEVAGVGFPLDHAVCDLRLETHVPAAALRHFFGRSGTCTVYVGAALTKRPTTVALTGDADSYLTDLHWTSWRLRRAVARGQLGQAVYDASGARTPGSTYTPVRVVATEPRDYTRFTDCGWGFAKVRIVDRRSGRTLSVSSGAALIRAQGAQCFPSR